MHLENARKEFVRTLRRRKETLGVFSLYAKRYKSVYISVNNNTNLNLFKILSNYIIWDRLSQKTISRYCPFKSCLLSKYLKIQAYPGSKGRVMGNIICFLIYLQQRSAFLVLEKKKTNCFSYYISGNIREHPVFNT